MRTILSIFSLETSPFHRSDRSHTFAGDTSIIDFQRDVKYETTKKWKITKSWRRIRMREEKKSMALRSEKWASLSFIDNIVNCDISIRKNIENETSSV